MKNKILSLLFFLIVSTLVSCELVEGIFNAGLWTGAMIVIAVLVVIIWLSIKIFGKRK
jgi:cytosine/uracil/thiamine/allantoin permease